MKDPRPMIAALKKAITWERKRKPQTINGRWWNGCLKGLMCICHYLLEQLSCCPMAALERYVGTI